MATLISVNFGKDGKGYAATSTTSLSIGTGSKTLTTQRDRAYLAGSRIRIASAAAPTSKWMEGVVTSYSGTSLVFTSDLTAGSGTAADWNLSIAGDASGLDTDLAAETAARIAADALKAPLASPTFTGTPGVAGGASFNSNVTPATSFPAIIAFGSFGAVGTGVELIGDGTYVGIANIVEGAGQVGLSFRVNRAGSPSTGGTEALRLSHTGAATFPGAVTAANLSGTNTGDQDLSSYATTSALNAAIAGLKYKASVRVATTANITLSGAQTIDGISVVAADRVLVKNQSTASQNGIYLCASGSWTRATDFDAWTEVPGSLVAVEVGAANADKVFLCTADQGGTLGSTSITFTEFGAGGGGGGGTAPNVGFVQSDGNDTTGTGTPSAPVATIQKAYDLGFRAFHLGNRTSGTHGALAVGSGNVTLYFTGDGNCAVGAVTKPSSGMLTVISQPNIVFASFDSQPSSGASAGFTLRNARVTGVVTTLAQNGADGATFGAAGATGADAGMLVFVRCEIGGAVLQQAGSGGNGAAAETGSESAGGNGGYGGAAGGIVAEYTHFLDTIAQTAGSGGAGGNGDGAGNGGTGNMGGNVGTTTYTHCTLDSSLDIAAGTAGAPGSPDPMLPASDGLASVVLICCTQNYLSPLNVTTSVELYQGMAGAVTCDSAILLNAYVSSVTASGSVSVIGAGISGTFYTNTYP